MQTLSVRFSKEDIKRLDDYRDKRGLKTRSKAAREILLHGLAEASTEEELFNALDEVKSEIRSVGKALASIQETLRSQNDRAEADAIATELDTLRNILAVASAALLVNCSKTNVTDEQAREWARSVFLSQPSC